MAGSSPVATSLADGARRGDDAAHDVTVGSDDDCAVAGVASVTQRELLAAISA